MLTLPREPTDVRQWRHIAFCISLLNVNEKAVRKLLENFKSYQEALQDAEVLSSFEQIVSKVCERQCVCCILPLYSFLCILYCTRL